MSNIFAHMTVYKNLIQVNNNTKLTDTEKLCTITYRERKRERTKRDKRLFWSLDMKNIVCIRTERQLYRLVLRAYSRLRLVQSTLHSSDTADSPLSVHKVLILN